MPVNIHGKDYKTVSERIAEFREIHQGFTIKTKILNAGDLCQVKATILNEEGRVLATGLAEEVRGSTNINRTSAMENCETSAVGRALAFLGFAGTEIASADEVANAIQQQAELELNKGFAAHMQAVLDNFDSIKVIKAAIFGHTSNDPEPDYLLSDAAEAWRELSEETQQTLWRAPTKGGVFTTQEREVMKSTEWREA